MMLLADKIERARSGHPAARGPVHRANNHAPRLKPFRNMNAAQPDLTRRKSRYPGRAYLDRAEKKAEPASTQIPLISNRDSNLLETSVTLTKQKTESFLIETKLHPLSGPDYTVPIPASDKKAARWAGLICPGGEFLFG
jgi:hypothetical protein